MPDKLSIWNGALGVIGERSLATLTENREPRYVIQEVWDRELVKTCLQKGQWNFATRAVMLEYDPGFTPDFGYQYGFVKPVDVVRLVGMYRDEGLQVPLEYYTDESGMWWADIETLYVRYVSDDDEWGQDYSLWPPNFTRFVEYYLAQQVLPRITHAQSKQQEIDGKVKDWLLQAKNTDAMDDAAPKLRRGSWSRARSHGGRVDEG